jgi:phage terminase large subunit-like protein
MSLRTLIKTLERITAPAVPTQGDYRWFDMSCPCGLPPGDCIEHPRARLNQRPPEGSFHTWLVLAGRGFGKSRTGAEWCVDEIRNHGARRFALVAPTAADARDVMVEGESGILAISPPSFMPKYEPSKRRLTWPNGAVATTFSAEEPNRLRGPQHDRAWCDELGAWVLESVWSNLRFGLRKGTPKVCVTTTPRPTALLKSILAESTTRLTKGSSYDNRKHLAPEFFNDIIAKYEGTRLGRQEIHAELLETLEGVVYQNWDPARHVSDAAEYQPGLAVRLAIDCGVSRHTGAIMFQVRENGPYRSLINVFADFYSMDQFSETNARQIMELVNERTNGIVDIVVLDPAASAKSGVGPSAFSAYQEVFGWGVGFSPSHSIQDGIDQVSMLLGEPGREPDLLVHSRCKHVIASFGGYTWAFRRGQWQSYVEDPCHPHEELQDAIRYGIRDALPAGRAIGINGIASGGPQYQTLHQSRKHLQ